MSTNQKRASNLHLFREVLRECNQFSRKLYAILTEHEEQLARVKRAAAGLPAEDMKAKKKRKAKKAAKAAPKVKKPAKKAAKKAAKKPARKAAKKAAKKPARKAKKARKRR